MCCTERIQHCHSHQQERYYLSKTCYDIITWDEVTVKNKVTSNRINSTILRAVKFYKIGKEDSFLLCDRKMGYAHHTNFKVVYAKKNLISYYLSTGTYYKGILHEFHQFRTLNFNAITGEQLHFIDIIDTTQISNLNAFIINKVARERINNSYEAVDSLALKVQVGNQEFNITNKGIELFYWYNDYPIDVLLSNEEVKPFINRHSFFNRYFFEQ